MTYLRALAASIQAALLVGLTILLIQPAAVPDPFGVGDALSWTVLCLAAGVPVLVSAARGRLPATRLDTFLWAYVLCSVVVLPFSHDRVMSAGWLLALAGNIVIFYAAVSATRASESTAAVMLVVVLLGVAALQVIAVEYHLERGLTELTRAYPRPEGWNGYPELGLLACIQMAILIALMSAVHGVLPRVAVIAVIGVTLLELMFLYSRMAWAAVVALFAVAPVAGRTKGIRWQWGLLGGATAVGIAFAIGQTEAGRTLRLRVTEPSAVAGRIEIWRRTGQMIQDHLLTGVGLGNFQAVYEPVYNPRLNPDERRGGHAHNLWLQVTAEQGVVTATAYVALWVAAFVFAWRQRRASWVQRAALLIVVVVAVRSMGDYMFFSTGGAPARLHTLLWITWGMIGAEASSGVKAR